MNTNWFDIMSIFSYICITGIILAPRFLFPKYHKKQPD